MSRTEDLARFAAGIRFRIIHPGTYNGLWVQRFQRLARRLGSDAELWITRLPSHSRELRARLAPLLAMPRMSTFALAAIINRAAELLAPEESFVNVGVWHGFTLLAGMAGHPAVRCVGVDNFSEFGGPRAEFLARFAAARSPAHAFHDMDYREYFRTVHQGPIGLYIYDGDHAYEHQVLGLEVAEPFFAPECIIVVDDTNWGDPVRATHDFMARRPGRYRVLFDGHTSGNHHPTLWNGVMVLGKIA